MITIIEYLKGKKTYLIGIIAIILGILQGFKIFTVPEWVWILLGGLGLTAIRASVTKIAETISSMKEN